MSRRNNPFGEIEELFDRMSQSFEGSGMRDVSVDVRETDDEVVVTADLPGYEKEDIEVGVKDRKLTLQAQRDEETEQGDETYLRQERTHRHVSRSVTLPEAVDEESATATYSNGVLTVTLPKRNPDEDDDSHSISIT